MIESVRILVDAGATPLGAVRAAAVLKAGGSYEDAYTEVLRWEGSGTLEDELLDLLSTMLSSEDERRLPESNRWKVPDHTAQPCGSEDDDRPRPQLVTPLRPLLGVEFASTAARAEA